MMGVVDMQYVAAYHIHPGVLKGHRRRAETLTFTRISTAHQQVAAPRLFKSHETASDVPAGARYVYVARNPLDAFVSFHRCSQSRVCVVSGR